MNEYCTVYCRFCGTMDGEPHCKYDWLNQPKPIDCPENLVLLNDEAKRTFPKFEVHTFVDDSISFSVKNSNFTLDLIAWVNKYLGELDPHELDHFKVKYGGEHPSESIGKEFGR